MMPDRKLRILYITQYFPPEIGATQTRAYEMAKNLAAQGHDVTVLCEFPNHPSGILPQRYHGKWKEKDSLDGITVYRTWVYTTPEKTFITRLLFYFSFMFSALVTGLFLPGKFDVVYTTSPPFFVGISGLVISKLRRARFVFEVRDIWPESAVVLGELNNRKVIRASEWLERLFYRHAEKIVVVTNGIRARLMARGIPASKLELITNGTNTEIFADRGRGKRPVLGLKDEFTICYAGIFGIAQGMDFLCDVIEQLKPEADIRFLFIGDGPRRRFVEQQKEERRLDNLILIKEIPRENIAEYISACDVSLVPLRKNELFTGALPSKMFDHMACARPLILSVDGEARKVLTQANAGLFVEPESKQEMIDVIIKLKNNNELREEMGRNGRSFTEQNYSRSQQARELESLLTKLVFKQNI
jgi:glycosyltransferase involved in cell wall biosynthesis